MTPRRSLDQADWYTSSYSTGSGDNCVEVGPATRVVGVRDSKHRAAGALAVTFCTWAAFLTAVKK